MRATLKVCVHRKKMQDKNLQIEKERPVGDIKQISIRPAQIAASVRTFKADEAWPKTTTQSCRRLLIIKLRRREDIRVRPDYGHIAAQHIDQHWKLIQANSNQNTSKGGYRTMTASSKGKDTDGLTIMAIHMLDREDRSPGFELYRQ